MCRLALNVCGRIAFVFFGVIHGIRGAESGNDHWSQHVLGPSMDAYPEIPLDDVWNASTVRNHLEEALEIMQKEYFEVWLGSWPTSIDWTGAVLGTHLSATARLLSRSADYSFHPNLNGKDSCAVRSQLIEDEINGYFSQVIAYYFGQDHISIRFQAHDDMLWVVLGWLESLRLIKTHDTLHHSTTPHQGPPGTYLWTPEFHWHGTLFSPAFAHRARVFYELVSGAWDTSLCRGGLNWNPNLEPYKNTVTNTQFIASAVGMYLYHPGDDNGSQILSRGLGKKTDENPQLPPSEPHDPAFLAIAREAYTWLQNINMTNSQGLYVDGYHLSSWYDPDTGELIWGDCEFRNEMVWTYNQGVILSGLRQLWEATGEQSYIEDAHGLVRNVISATGWPRKGTGWQGLGYDGFLTEVCDPHGTCTQDAHTFKGIFFHHLTLLCEPLPTFPLLPGKSYAGTPEQRALHANSCRSYLGWVEHNARAAWGTRNAKGIMGTWWGGPGIDMEPGHWVMPQPPEGADTGGYHMNLSESGGRDPKADGWDWNDRGRGRTVESHSGGLAALEALYALHMFYS